VLDNIECRCIIALQLSWISSSGLASQVTVAWSESRASPDELAELAATVQQVRFHSRESAALQILDHPRASIEGTAVEGAFRCADDLGFLSPLLCHDLWSNISGQQETDPQSGSSSFHLLPGTRKRCNTCTRAA